MSRFVACILNDEVDLDNERFSPECLKDMESNDQIPIWDSFDNREQIGTSENRKYSNGNLYAFGEIDWSLVKDLVPVVGFQVKEYEIIDGVKVYKDIELRHIALTNNPSTEHTWITKRVPDGDVELLVCNMDLSTVDK